MRSSTLTATGLFMIAALICTTPLARAEDAYALKCQSADGTRQFPAVRPPYALRTSQDKNAFHALIRTLGITYEQYQAWGVTCVQIMGLNDPRPYSNALREKEFRKEHADCLPPDEVVAMPHGSVLHKVTNGCSDTLEQKDLGFVVGIVSIGIEKCGFSQDPASRAAYMRAMLSLTPAMMFDLTIHLQLAEGQQFANTLQCSKSLQEFTAKSVSYIQRH